MLTESLPVVCIHLLFSAAPFRVEKELYWLETSLFCSPSHFLFILFLFPLTPSLRPPPFFAWLSSQHPLTASSPVPTIIHTHTHTHLCPPLLISSPRVRDQSGEGLAVGVMRGWSWEPSRVRSALSPGGERERESERVREITCSSLARQSTLLAVHAFAWAAPIEMYKETLTGRKKKHTKETETQTFFFSPSSSSSSSSSEISQIHAGTNRLCQSWQHRQ